MPTIWIHRARASDILIDFSSMIHAYNYAIEFIAKYHSDDYMIHTNLVDMLRYNLNMNDDKNYMHLPPEGIDIVQANDVQIRMITTNTRPDSSWNERGFIKVSREEALDLGISNEPENFIPYESSSVWMKETRSTEELNAELESYMNASVSTV
jgi:hypothetical protein